MRQDKVSVALAFIKGYEAQTNFRSIATRAAVGEHILRLFGEKGYRVLVKE